MIIEGLCTTLNEDGSVNVAPMGPVVNEELTNFLFRPFQTSTTFQNLKARRAGVYHVTDDVGMIARAAIGQLDQTPETFAAETVTGRIIASACRWYEFEVIEIDDSQPRSEIRTHVTHVGRIRDFWGFNRAKHAILEAAILATRLHLTPRNDVQQQILALQTIVDKTASEADADTFAFLKLYIAENS